MRPRRPGPPPGAGRGGGERRRRPRGMTRAPLRPLEAIAWPVAVGHEPQESGPPTVVRPMVEDTRIWPAGYAFSSLNDLSRLDVALLNGGRLDGKHVLPAGRVAPLPGP